MSNLVTDAEAKKVIYAEAGEWVPHSSIMEWGCCDCGLVHDVEFRLNGSGQLEVRMFRNQEKTIAARTQKRIHAVTFVASHYVSALKDKFDRCKSNGAKWTHIDVEDGLRLLSERERLLAIVRAMTNREPYYRDEDANLNCSICRTLLPDFGEADNHDETCSYRLAIEYMAEVTK